MSTLEEQCRLASVREKNMERAGEDRRRVKKRAHRKQKNQVFLLYTIRRTAR